MKIEDLDKILNPKDFSWIEIKKYEPDFKECDKISELAKEYNKLSQHHHDETEFLINKCRELAQELKSLKETPEPTIVPWND